MSGHVLWSNSDDDIPAGTVGVVTGVNEKGNIVVKFPKGSWGLKGSSLTNALAVGTTVYSRTAYDVIPHGTAGRVESFNDDKGTVNCSFPSGSYQLNHNELLTTEQERARARAAVRQ